MALITTVRRDWSGLRATLCALLLVTPCDRAFAQRSPRPFRVLSASGMTLRDSIVAIARAQVGRKYVHGGATPSGGFDCSGFVKYVLHSLRIEVPRTTRQQSLVGNAVAQESRFLRPGDLLLFGKGKDGVSHVGIYVGHERFVHVSSVAGRVIESPLNRPPSPLIKVLISARRVLDFGDRPPARASSPGVAGAFPAMPTTPATIATSATPAKQQD